MQEFFHAHPGYMLMVVGGLLFLAAGVISWVYEPKSDPLAVGMVCIATGIYFLGERKYRGVFPWRHRR